MTEPANVTERLERKKAAVEAELERLLHGDPPRLFEAMRYAVLGGGKRYRPLLLLAAGEAFGAREKILLPYACAVELIHCYSLVHDDLPSMDNDDFRRGKPTVHKAFGEGPAVLVGDALQSLAFEVLARAPYEPGKSDRKGWALEIITSAAGVQGMIRGQWLDISLTPEGAGEEVYNDIAGRKTGALIRASVVAGAILGGATGEALAVAAEYGAAVGLAFQLRDDLADAKPADPRAGHVSAVHVPGKRDDLADTESADSGRGQVPQEQVLVIQDVADSGQPGAPPAALDAVSLFGRDVTVERLAASVAAALAALARGGIDSEELRVLAKRLEPEGAA